MGGCQGVAQSAIPLSLTPGRPPLCPGAYEKGVFNWIITYA